MIVFRYSSQRSTTQLSIVFCLTGSDSFPNISSFFYPVLEDVVAEVFKLHKWNVLSSHVFVEDFNIGAVYQCN